MRFCLLIQYLRKKEKSVHMNTLKERLFEEKSKVNEQDKNNSSELIARSNTDDHLAGTILSDITGMPAEDLLKKFRISLQPPINLYLLIKRLGFATKERDFSEIEEKAGLPNQSILGATMLLDGKVILYYKSGESFHRTKFTLAHELAHCICHLESIDHMEFRNDITDLNNKKEIEANRYAGELLIPESSLRDIMQRLLGPSLTALSQIFDVSTNVMEKRLQDLGIPYLYDLKKTQTRYAEDE